MTFMSRGRVLYCSVVFYLFNLGLYDSFFIRVSLDCCAILGCAGVGYISTVSRLCTMILKTTIWCLSSSCHAGVQLSVPDRKYGRDIYWMFFLPVGAIPFQVYRYTISNVHRHWRLFGVVSRTQALPRVYFYSPLT